MLSCIMFRGHRARGPGGSQGQELASCCSCPTCLSWLCTCFALASATVVQSDGHQAGMSVQGMVSFGQRVWRNLMHVYHAWPHCSLHSDANHAGSTTSHQSQQGTNPLWTAVRASCKQHGGPCTGMAIQAVRSLLKSQCPHALTRTCQRHLGSSTCLLKAMIHTMAGHLRGPQLWEGAFELLCSHHCIRAVQL